MPFAYAEGEVTKLRREFKLVLQAREAASLIERLFPRGRSERPRSTQVVSVYFDRPGFPLAQRAIQTPHHCLKVRTKEYFPDLGRGEEDRVVLEVKRERNGVTQKRRVWLPRTQLGAVMRDGAESGLVPLIARGQLIPTLAVTYERLVFQREESWRVTVDREVSFYPVTAAVALSPERLGRERLGPPSGREEKVVVEVKHLGDTLPNWLAALSRERTHRYSKFAEGIRRLAATRVDGVTGG